MKRNNREFKRPKQKKPIPLFVVRIFVMILIAVAYFFCVAYQIYTEIKRKEAEAKKYEMLGEDYQL